MAISPIQTNNPFGELSRLFAEAADTNCDGHVCQDEFATFLANLLESLHKRTTSAATTTSLLPATHSTVLTASSALVPLADRANRPRMSGYSLTKLADLSHTTPKYIFGRVAQNVDLSSVVDKASAEALLVLMRPALEAAGLTVLDVSKDKLQMIDDEGGTEWIDVIYGSRSGNPAFQWLPVVS